MSLLNFIDEDMDTERYSDSPRAVELGFMLVICTKPCWTPKPDVGFISGLYSGGPAQMRSPMGSLCSDGRCNCGLRSKKTQERTAVNSPTR